MVSNIQAKDLRVATKNLAGNVKVKTVEKLIKSIMGKLMKVIE